MLQTRALQPLYFPRANHERGLLSADAYPVGSGLHADLPLSLALLGPTLAPLHPWRLGASSEGFLLPPPGCVTSSCQSFCLLCEWLPVMPALGKALVLSQLHSALRLQRHKVLWIFLM